MRQVFQPIKVLNSRTFRKNKGRNLVAVLAIIMTSLMFTTLFTLAQSMNRNLIEMTFRQTGSDAHISFRSITQEELAQLAAHPDVAQTSASLVLGVADSSQLGGRQVEIRWAQDDYAQHSFSLPATGSMPQSADEIALDTIALDRLGIPHELGQAVTLSWYPGQSSGEESLTSTFTLCGFWEGNESSYASMAWVSQDFAREQSLSQDGETSSGAQSYTAMVNLYDDGRLEEDISRILADTGLSSLEYSVNLAYSPEMGAAAFQESIPMYLGMVLVFLAGYLIIYNIFQISVTADVQFYGQLKTLGTTTRQIKRLIYSQSNRLCLIGIPIGLILGWLLGMVLVPVMMGMAEGEHTVSANPLIFLGSALFAWVTVTLSCLRPARLAGKVSPIEALRASDNTSYRRKKTRRRRLGSVSLASMAWANLWRSPKRTITVICSLTLGLVLLSCFYAHSNSFDMDKYLADLTIADFELDDATDSDYLGGYDPQGTTLNDSLVSQLESMEGVESTGHLYSGRLDWQMDEQTYENMRTFYTDERLADWASYDPSGAQAMQAAFDSCEVSAVIWGLDGIPLDMITQERYILEGSFDPEVFASGDSILAVGPSIDLEGGAPEEPLPAPTPGTAIELGGRTYTVMAVVYPLNPITEGAPQTGSPDMPELSFILPADIFRQLWPDNTLRRLYLNADDAHLEEISSFLEEYTSSVDTTLPVTSRETMADQYEAELRSSSVLGSAVSIVIALVGVLNFINSMVTAIVSRRREFAMIQSVGMTKRQLCRMLVFEGLYYAAITLAASYLISSLAVGIVIRAMVAGGFTTFRFTLLPLILCTPVLLFFAVLIPYICFKNVERMSITERLRME